MDGEMKFQFPDHRINGIPSELLRQGEWKTMQLMPNTDGIVARFTDGEYDVICWALQFCIDDGFVYSTRVVGLIKLENWPSLEPVDDCLITSDEASFIGYV